MWEITIRLDLPGYKDHRKVFKKGCASQPVKGSLSSCLGRSLCMCLPLCPPPQQHRLRTPCKPPNQAKSSLHRFQTLISHLCPAAILHSSKWLLDCYTKNTSIPSSSLGHRLREERVSCGLRLHPQEMSTTLSTQFNE